MITKAAVARHAGAPVAIETLTLDEPREGEVLVRLVASGVAHADLDAIGSARSPFPFVPGGEGAGIVERAGPGVTTLAPGDAVVLLRGTWPRADGSQPFSQDDGDPGGSSVAGFAQSSFAGHCLSRADALAPVAVDAPLELLAGLGGEVRAAVGAVLDHVGGGGTDALVVVGAGAAGLAAVMAARARDAATIIVCDPDADRRALATELGASLTVHADEDLAAAVRSLVGGGAAFALDTTGHPNAVAACRAAVAPGGACGSVRRLEAGSGVLDFSDAPDPARAVTIMAGWYAENRFPLEKLISFFPFEHVNDALAALAGNAVVKPVIRFSLGPFADLDRAGAEGAAVEEPDNSEPEATPAGAPAGVLQPQ